MEGLDVEVVLKKHSTVRKTDITTMCTLYLSSIRVKAGTTISNFTDVNNRVLSCDVERILIGELKTNNSYVDVSKVQINWFVYKLDDFGPQTENCEDETGGEMNLSTHWTLPSQEMVDLWENLIYDSDIKENLLKYAHTMMEFSDRGVNSNVISCNRVILLHGPPGTGKTSLCKALAHKLSIRMQNRFKQAVLIEINSHSLFSKYFSESGKLVTKMFTKVKEIVEEPNRLVCVLIDEIESLAHARQQCMSGNEPSDSIRVVNAVLTQIDQIKQFPNVLIFSTSNITEAIDVAFIDRADIKQYLGLPTKRAVYQIYYTCIQELLKTGIVQSKVALQKVSVKSLQFGEFDEMYDTTKSLLRLSEKSVGFSGRTLRKIPFVAHALFLKSTGLELEQFLDAMDSAIDYEIEQRKHFSIGDNGKK